MVQDENHNDFFKGERNAQRHVAWMLRGRRGSSEQKSEDAWGFPPLLLASVVATVPLLIASVFFIVYCGQQLLDYAKVAQSFAQSLDGRLPGNTSDLFTALDFDADLQLSAEETHL